MRLGTLHIASAQALPFAREKLRAALVCAGFKPTQVGQWVGQLSQTLREFGPRELTVSLEGSDTVLLGSPELTTRWHRLQLPVPLGEEDQQQIQTILARMSREELLHDLERQVQERTADLNAERLKSETLLRHMLPASIAKRLKNGETIADQHLASVVFVDMVGFTRWASRLHANELVAHLGQVFGEFDGITRQHGLEKIKTIGDCYMAAAGLPEPQHDHAERAVRMGLDILRAMPRICIALNAPIQVRVGIHCGPLVAGVIGSVKPFYDIWGDTVNVASRMESHGLPGRLHISDDVRAALGDGFELEQRGVIEVKNRGPMTTWFVNGMTRLKPAPRPDHGPARPQSGPG